MKFNVSTPQGKLPVDFKFASERDLRTVLNWRSKASIKDNPHVQDALEYRRLATKRWRSYSRNGRTVSSLRALTTSVRKDNRAEVVFVLVAHAKWHTASSILGFCFCRRTWCNHIIIDFASVHPNAIRAVGGPIRGLGAAMVYSLAKLSSEIGVSLIWGEATENSVEFYRKVLKSPEITDHFFISGPVFDDCIQQFETVKLGKGS